MLKGVPMLDQPPPDAPPPPPSPAAILSRRKWRTVWMTGTVSILALIGLGLIEVEVRERRIRPNRQEAIINLLSMSGELSEFKLAYGSYPDDSTRLEVKKTTGSKLSLGNRSSNDYFRQLIAAEICQSEAVTGVSPRSETSSSVSPWCATLHLRFGGVWRGCGCR
jgi:hypothetical protein